MTAGYSGSPLPKKLGIKEHQYCIFLNTPDHYFDLIADAPDYFSVDIENAENESADFIHVFVQFQDDLFHFWQKMKPKLRKDGMVWISWPKGKSDLEKDLDGNTIRRVGLEGGLVDVKICAVDEDWSGLKFMYRKEDR